MRKLCAAFLLLGTGPVAAKESPWSINLETGTVWQNRNDVRIPGDTGTRYSIPDTIGKGPYPFYRLE
jgi:hypothetical protein